MNSDSTNERKPDAEMFLPSPDMMAKANVPVWEAEADHAQQDLTGFWAERAHELEWYKPWDTVLDESKKPFYKWFVGG